MVKQTLCFATSLACLAAAACNDRYIIEMATWGDILERRITCWTGEEDEIPQGDDNFPKADLARIAAIYPLRFTASGATVHSFEGRFREDTPNDVGGAGSYIRRAVLMGASCSYVERFRDTDDMSALLDDLEKRRQAASKVTDLLIGWLRTEIGADPRFDKLHAFLDKDFRKDLQNVATYKWLPRAASTETIENREGYLRIVQYLVERGYATPADIIDLTQPGLYWMINPDRCTRTIRRLIADRMGISNPKEAEEALPFLSSWERVMESVDAYLRTTEEYKALAAKKAAKDPEKTVEPTDAALEPLLLAIGFSFHDVTLVRVRLALPREPFSTNGKWIPESRRIEWQPDFAKDGVNLAPFCYALWSEPDEAFQKAHFGGVVLDKEPLAKYVAWRGALAEEDGREWDSFLANLDPKMEWQEDIKQFRFKRQHRGEKSLVQPAVDLFFPPKTGLSYPLPDLPTPEEARDEFVKNTGIAWPESAKIAHWEKSHYTSSLVFDVTDEQMKKWLESKPPWGADAWKEGPFPQYIRRPILFEFEVHEREHGACPKSDTAGLEEILRSPRIRYATKDRDDILILDPLKLRVRYCRWDH